MWWSKLREQNLAVRAVLLLLVMTGGLLLASPIAWNTCGREGLLSATVAGLSSLVGCSLALVIGEPFRRSRHMLQGLLLGMVFRMGVPLAVALIVRRSGQHLIEAGFLYYLVVFFEMALLVEVFLSLPPREEHEERFQKADNTPTP